MSAGCVNCVSYGLNFGFKITEQILVEYTINVFLSNL